MYRVANRRRPLRCFATKVFRRSQPKDPNHRICLATDAIPNNNPIALMPLFVCCKCINKPKLPQPTQTGTLARRAPIYEGSAFNAPKNS